MTATTWATPRPTLNIGVVVGATLATASKAAGPLATLAIPLIIIPQALTTLLPKDLQVLNLAVNLIGLIFQGGAVMIAYGSLTAGQPVSAGEAASAAARRFGALWGAGILSGLGILLGTILLVVPGVILLTGWMVSSPALLIEGLSATRSLDRSWALTKGVRWPLAALLGLLILFLVVAVAVVFAVTFGLDAMFGEAFGSKIADLFVVPVFVAVFAALTSVGSTVVYVQLTRAKEGVLNSEIAEVFT